MAKLQKVELIANPNKERILAQLADRKDIKGVIQNITEGDEYYSEELYQELFLVLCELDEERIVSMYNEKWLDWYIVRTLSNMFNSVNSRFYYNIKKPIVNKVDHVTEDERDMIEEYPAPPQLALPDNTGRSIEVKHQYLEELETAINQLYWFNKEIVNHYLKLGTIKKVSEATGINTATISLTLQASRKELKEIINKGMKTLNEQNF